MQELYIRQADLERESVLLGQHRYTTNLEGRGESESAPGKEQTKRTVDALAKAIAEFLERDSAGRGKKVLGKYLTRILPEQAAYLTIRFALDGASINQKAATVALKIGAAIEDHIDLINLEHQEYTMPDGTVTTGGLYRKVIEQVKSATADHHRTAVLRYVTRKYGKPLVWNNREKLLLGTKLIELFDESCGLVTKQLNTEGHHNTQVRIVFTPAAAEWLAAAHAQSSLMQPVHQPMVYPPRDWSTPFDGGYLTGALRRAKMIQTHIPGVELLEAREQMGTVYAAVNAVQRTPWRISKGILGVMQEAHGAGERYQQLFCKVNEPVPPRPVGVPESGQLTPEQKEQLTLWKRKASEVHGSNARLGSKRTAVRMKLNCAEKFLTDSAIYFPHYLDFRGRIYPYASHLNPQSDDVGRALLEFGVGKPLGERGLYWLKVHTANLFGVDKVTFDERVKWVNDHMEEIYDSATLPLDGQMFWASADNGSNAWQALAACMEITGAALDTTGQYVSHLPIAMDGSCSGLQHYSAMLRDPVGGAAVNLVPASKPGDIYTEVAKRAQALIDSSLEEAATPWKGDKVVRKIAKQPTMTMCYSATVFGMQSQIASAVEKLGGEDYLSGYDVREASAYCAGVIWDAIGQTVVAAKEAMAFLKSCAQLANEARMEIRWTTPAGFIAQQAYKTYRSQVVKVHYKGKRVELTLAEDTKVIDVKRQVAGIAPNFIHSLDSAHLMATVVTGMINGLDHWAVIHDSFGVHAADIDVLHACIREAFIEQYTPNVLERFREQMIEQLPEELAAKVPEVPPTGSLDLAAVRESLYFFA